jgi:hypothetical protein
LQLDRFEEDLNISKVRLRPSAPPPDSSRSTPTDPPPPTTPAQLQNLRQQAKAAVARTIKNSQHSTIQPLKPVKIQIPLKTSVVITVRKLPRIACDGTKNITATDSTLKNPAVKRLGLA